MLFFPAGVTRVNAGFWDSNKDGITTVLKGLLMLWIMNLISENTGNDNNNDDNEDLLTSTIKKGLNLDENSSDNNNTEDENEDQVSDITITSEEDEKIEKNVLDGEKVEEKTGENKKNNNEEFKLNDREKEMLDLINQERETENLKPLTINKTLTRVARLKAEDMNKNDYFEHFSPTYGSPFDMLKERKVNYLLAGENIAGASSVERGFQELMNSPDHKKNILEPRYDRVGIGIISGGKYGLIIVQIFTESGVI